MKKSILSSKILLASGLLLFTIECKCPADEKKQLRQAESTIEDMKALFAKAPKLSKSLEQADANHQKMENFIKELDSIAISDLVKFVENQQINRLDKADNYDPGLGHAYKDIKRKEKKEILPYINKSAELLINTIEAIKELFYSESEEIIGELLKVFSEFSEEYKECEKEGKTFALKIDEIIGNLTNYLDKFKCLDKKNDASLKKCYEYFTSDLNKTITNLNESFKEENTDKLKGNKGKTIEKSRLAMQAYLLVLLNGCIQKYLYHEAKNINQRKPRWE